MKKQLKVDTLVHISDHGTGVTFTNPHWNAVVDGLRPDGKTTLTAGKSTLTVTTVGRVTFTDFEPGVGARVRRVHYSGPDGLVYRHTRSELGHTYDTLSAVILGTKMPSIWNTLDGTSQDTLRGWLKSHAWALAGEAGLRAKAIQAARLKRSEPINALRTTERVAAIDAERVKTADYEKCLVSSKTALRRDLNYYAEQIAQVPDFGDDYVPPKYNGWHDPLSPYGVRMKGDAGPYVPSTPETWSHLYVSANQRATLKDDTFVLTSGILCDITPSATLAWLQGNAPAPKSRYGTCKVIETRDDTNSPVKLVTCGCHVVDLGPLGPEWAEALKPTHEVTLSPGTRRLTWEEDREAVLQVMRQGRDKVLGEIAERRNRCLADYIAHRDKIKLERQDAPQIIEHHLAKSREAADKAAELEKALADDPVLGKDLITEVNKAVLTAVNALAGIKVS